MFNRISLSITVLLTLVAATAGFFVGKSVVVPIQLTSQDQPSVSIIKSDPIFQKYLASFQGEIVGVIR